jgi:hypothetical protein
VSCYGGACTISAAIEGRRRCAWDIRQRAIHSIRRRAPEAKVIGLFQGEIDDLLADAPPKPNALEMALRAGLMIYHESRNPLKPIIGDDGYAYCGMEDHQADLAHQRWLEAHALIRDAARLILASK